jgi:hypothetical protein
MKTVTKIYSILVNQLINLRYSENHKRGLSKNNRVSMIFQFMDLLIYGIIVGVFLGDIK